MHVVLINSVPNRAGLSLIGKTEEWLFQEITKKGFTSKELFFATANSAGELYAVPIQSKKERKKRP